MSDLSISRQKAAKIIFPSHPDPSPPPSLRDGELMRFLFFYFFLFPSSSREDEREREEEGPTKPRTAAAAVLQITFRHSACARRVLVRLALSLSSLLGESAKGRKDKRTYWTDLALNWTWTTRRHCIFGLT